MLSRSCPLTVAPRFFFGNSANCMPLAKVMRRVRCSMLAGLASKASPSSNAARPL